MALWLSGSLALEDGVEVSLAVVSHACIPSPQERLN